MSVDLIAIFDHRVTLDWVAGYPDNMLAACPTIRADVERAGSADELLKELRDGRTELSHWSPANPILLFGPRGLMELRPHTLSYRMGPRFRWFFEHARERHRMRMAYYELASHIGSRRAIYVPDVGDADDIVDRMLDANGSLADMEGALASGLGPPTLAQLVGELIARGQAESVSHVVDDFDGLELEPEFDYRRFITIAPDIRSGQPCICGTRISVQDVLDRIVSGMSIEQILEDFPALTRDHIRAVLHYTVAKLEEDS